MVSIINIEIKINYAFLKKNLPESNCICQILKAKSSLRKVETLKHLNIDTDKTKLHQEQYKII